MDKRGPCAGGIYTQAPIDYDSRKYNQNLPGMGGVFNAINLHLYHYAGNNPVKYTDPDGREDENLIKEITDCIDEIKVGFNEKISLKIPGLINFEISIDAASYDAVNNKGDESDSGYTQGVTFTLEVGPEGFPAVSGFFKYEKKVQTNAFDLLDADFETSHDLKPNTDLKVTIPIPCVPITINISEVADFLNKATIKIYETSKEKSK